MKILKVFLMFSLFAFYKSLFATPYESIIQEGSQRYGVEVPLIKGVIMQESRWKPTAVSHAGAAGLMQLMPGTGKEMGITPQQRFNIYKNIMAGTKYLAKQARLLKKRKGGGTLLAVASYNAGRGHIEKAINRTRTTDVKTVLQYLPRITGKHAKETQNYVKQVYKYYKKYGGTNINYATSLDFKTNDALGGKLAPGAITAGSVAWPSMALAEYQSSFVASVGSTAEAIEEFTKQTSSIHAIGFFILMLLLGGFLIWAAAQAKNYWELFAEKQLNSKDMLFMLARTIALTGLVLTVFTIS